MLRLPLQLPPQGRRLRQLLQFQQQLPLSHQAPHPSRRRLRPRLPIRIWRIFPRVCESKRETTFLLRDSLSRRTATRDYSSAASAHLSAPSALLTLSRTRCFNCSAATQVSARMTTGRTIPTQLKLSRPVSLLRTRRNRPYC